MRSPRARRPLRVASLISMVVGLVSTGVGAVSALSAPHHGGTPPTIASPSPSRPAPAPSPSATPVAVSSTCTNDVFGYTLTYPSGWIASSATPEQGCRFFDTVAISRTALLRATRTGREARAAIQVFPFGVSYTRAVVEIHNRDDVRVIDTVDMGLGNSSGERITAKVAGPDGLPARLLVYVFDVRGRAFVADAYEPFSASFATTTRVLDAMMRTLHVA